MPFGPEHADGEGDGPKQSEQSCNIECEGPLLGERLQESGAEARREREHDRGEGGQRARLAIKVLGHGCLRGSDPPQRVEQYLDCFRVRLRAEGHRTMIVRPLRGRNWPYWTG